MTLRKIIAIFIVMLGLAMLNFGGSSLSNVNTLIGNWLVLLAVVPEALFTILSKSVGKKISEMEAVILVNFFNFMLFLPLVVIGIKDFHPSSIGTTTYLQLLLYGFTGGIMFFLLWYRGLTKINANTAALFTGIMPVSTTFFAFMILKESITYGAVFGMVLVILAIFIGCMKRSIPS